MIHPARTQLRDILARLLCGIASALPLADAAPVVAQTATQPSSASEAAFENHASAAKRLRPAALPYPAAIQKSIDASRRYCLAEGGTSFVSSPGLVRTGDLSGGGRADYVIDLREARCTGRPPLFSSTGGWDVEIYVARAQERLVRVFAGNVLDYDIDVHHRRSMLFRLHGSYCGKFGPDLCIKRRRLDGRPFDLRYR